MTLAERLKIMRASLGYTQKEMAKAVDTSPQVWQVYESGKSIPGGKVLEALARMGINVNWLLTGEGKERLPVPLTYTEAHDRLRGALRPTRAVISHLFEDGIKTPEGVEMTPLQLRRYLKGEYIPSREQLIEMVKQAGLSDDIEFINSLVGEDYIKKREEAMTMATAKIDDDLMQAIAIAVERHLEGRKLTLTPEKKARLYVHLYEIFFEDHQVKEETVERVLRLVA